MGLATDRPVEPVEVDEDVKRRQFLGVAAAAAVGADLPVLDVGSPGMYADSRSVRRVAAKDVAMLDAMVDRLRTLDQEQGGQTVTSATTALLRQAHSLVDAKMSGYTRTKLFGLLAHTHSFVGWQLSDSGRYSSAREHFQHSVTAGHHGHNHPALARTLHLAARNELIWSDPGHALRLFQFAQLAADKAGSPLLRATILADASIVLAEHSHTDLARSYMSRATDLLGTVDFDNDPAPWFQASDVTSALSATKFHIGHQDEAIAEITDALNTTALNRSRSRAFRAANLAEFHLTAGDHDEGVQAGITALELAAEVTSARLPVRLAPAARAASRYRTTDTRDLARSIRSRLSAAT